MTRRILFPSARFCYILAGELQLIEADRECAELLGFDIADFLSSKVSLPNRIHPDDADLKAQIFSPGAPLSGTVCLRVRHADGRIRCLQVEFEKEESQVLTLVLRHPPSTGKCSGTAAASLCAALENTDEATFFKDTNHRFTAASRAFKTMIANLLANRELVGLTNYDLLPEQDADTYHRSEKQALATGQPLQAVHEVTLNDRSITWIHIRLYPLRSETGETQGLFAIIRDLTARITAEELQEETMGPLRGQTRPPDVGTYVLDVRRGVFAASANLDSIFGIEKTHPHDAAGWEQLVHPADRANMAAYVRSLLAVPGQIFNKEYRIIRPSDGAERWMHGIGRIDRDAEGAPLVMRGTIEDITPRKQIESALRETKERLQLFIEHAPAALAMLDRDMRYLAVSSRWIQAFNLDTEPIVGRNHYEVFPDIPERWTDAYRRGLAGEDVHNDEDRFERSDGSVQWLRWEVLPWRREDGEVAGIVIFIEDITDWKRSEERAKLAASVFDYASEAILVTDLSGSILNANDAFIRMTGYEREELLGKNPRMLKSGYQGAAFYEEMWRSIRKTGRWRGELWNRAKDGSLYAVMSTLTTVFDSAGKPQYYLGLCSDITPIKDQERKLKQVAYYDILTGLPNRVLFAEKLREAMQAALKCGDNLAVAYIDLDDFKKINDEHGKQIADALLAKIADRMRHVLREGDLLGRPAGDEFVVLLPTVRGIAATHLLERLLQAIAEPHLVGEQTLRVSASAGATFYPQDEDVDADQLLRQADQAMYEAKLAGKNRFHVFDPVRDYGVRGRHGKLHELEAALSRGEFVLYYQPKVNMATGTLIGAEALIRWIHPQRGVLSPDQFLPIVEDDDLAIKVGEWVIDTALGQIDAWAKAGHRVTVSVNMSPRHLQQTNFIEQLQDLLHAHPQVDPTCLELEILETTALRDVEYVSRVIDACADMGISVAIDDFGTGYSSLTYLKRLPASVLKIDQSFVHDMLEDPDDLAILQGVMGLVNAFRRVAVAEGVENVEHGILLLRLGCVFAQGYGIARPMPAGDLLTWYTGWRPDPRWKCVTQMSPLDWPILTAEVELRAWNHALERYFAGERATPPEMDDHECRFGIWLNTEKLGPRAGSSSIGIMASLHAQAHEAARTAIELKKNGITTEALRWMRHAIELRGEIQTHLSILLADSGQCAPMIDGGRAKRPETPAKLQ